MGALRERSKLAVMESREQDEVRNRRLVERMRRDAEYEMLNRFKVNRQEIEDLTVAGDRTSYVRVEGAKFKVVRVERSGVNTWRVHVQTQAGGWVPCETLRTLGRLFEDEVVS